MRSLSNNVLTRDQQFWELEWVLETSFLMHVGVCATCATCAIWKRQVAKLASVLFHRWSLLRNNDMATNLQRFISSYGTRRVGHVTVEHRHIFGRKCCETVTSDSGKLRSFVLCEKRHEWKRSIAAPTKRDFCDCCRNMGHFRYGVERAKRFVNVHLHCIVSNMKRMSKISRLTPWKNFCGRQWWLPIITLLPSFVTVILRNNWK